MFWLPFDVSIGKNTPPPLDHWICVLKNHALLSGLEPEEAMMIAQVSHCTVQENKENYEVS